MSRILLRPDKFPINIVVLVFICVLCLTFLYHPRLSISVNNYSSPLESYKHKHPHYHNLLIKWLEYNGNSSTENDFTNDDTVFGDIVRNLFVEDPMFPEGKYGFNAKTLDIMGDVVKLNGQYGQPLIVDAILDKKRNGFFIEAGGVDGLHLSNSLFFELQRNFSGVLIEPSSKYKILRQRNRKVKSLNVCLSRKPFPEMVTFLDCLDIGGIEGEVKGWTKDIVNAVNTTRTSKLCLPLHAILFALGNPKVDYFSLDVEGVELDILKSIPWSKVDIDILSIEVSQNGRNEEELSETMQKFGYTKVVSQLKGTDDIFVRNDFRSPIFGPDQKPKMIEHLTRLTKEGFDWTKMGSELLFKFWPKNEIP